MSIQTAKVVQRLSSVSRNRYLRVFVPTILTIGLLVIVINAMESQATRQNGAGVRLNSVKSATSQSSANVKVETVIFDGERFEPATISRPAGEFLLGIDDHSRKADVAFELVREDGVKVLEIRTPRKMLRHRKVVKLEPGNYLLREASSSSSVCRVSITN